MIIWAWLDAAALTFWIGILVIEGVVLNGKGQRSELLALSRKQSQPLQWLCLSVLFVAEIIMLFLRAVQITQSLNGNILDISVLNQLLFQSTYGFLWMARIILILGSLGLLWWATRQQRWSLAFLCLAGLILLTYALSGDAAQQPSQLSFYAIVLGWFSLVALSSWIGGLAYTGYVLLSLLPGIAPERRKGALTAFLRRFSALILTTIGVVIVSELYGTMSSLSSSWQIGTAYGRAQLVKWILILFMILCSAYVFFILRPKLTRRAVLLPSGIAEGAKLQVRQSTREQTTRNFRLVLRIQTWLGAAVLLCVALMTFSESPVTLAHMNDNHNVGSSTPSSFLSTQTKEADGLSVALTVVPGKIDVSNTVEVQITDAASGKSVTDVLVVIDTIMDQMDMGKQQQTMTGGDPTYSTTFAKDTTFSMTGYWDITLTIKLPNRSPFEVPFTVWFTA